MERLTHYHAGASRQNRLAPPLPTAFSTFSRPQKPCSASWVLKPELPTFCPENQIERQRTGINSSDQSHVLKNSANATKECLELTSVILREDLHQQGRARRNHFVGPSFVEMPLVGVSLLYFEQSSFIQGFSIRTWLFGVCTDERDVQVGIAY